MLLWSLTYVIMTGGAESAPPNPPS
ncbi:hypothetical protein SPHINGO391_440125 [Sphingomonas aurantiaca]|uniref:Uncharacterized protein n=1 Tax=Sphingomonas aurantiaca TaxID=185949 RepID=A0A5E7Z3E8_9SPHN|nr:hypothetical protein SPHINGO391_440125 [Sphingomonas aurantiaca]